MYYPKVYKGSKKTDLGLPKLEKYDAYRVLKSIAVNPKTPKSILAKLSTAADYDIRVDVATNPSTPKTVLERYAEKEESYIREMVAKDRMCWVQEAAKHRLNALASEKK